MNKNIVFRSLKDVRIPKEPMNWIVENMIAPETLNFIIGDGATKKTWVALALAFSIANGYSFVGRSTRKSRVCYLNFEMSEYFFELRAQMVDKGMCGSLDASIVIVNQPDLNLTKKEDLSVLRQICEEYDLLIIDALSDAVPGIDESGSSDLSLFFSEIMKIKKDTGCTFLILHHTTKNGETYRGSTEIRNKADLMLLFRSDDDSKYVNIKTLKNRNGQLINLNLAYKADDTIFQLEEEITGLPDLSPIQKYIIAWAKSHDRQIVKSDLDGAKKYATTSLRDAIVQLEKDNIIEKVKSDVYKGMYVLSSKIK